MIEIQVKITGSEKTRDDKLAALMVGNLENENRQHVADAANEKLQSDADQTNSENESVEGDEDFVAPDLAIADILPLGTNVEIYNAYEFYLARIMQPAHTSYVEQATEKDLNNREIRELFNSATDAQRDAAISALGG